MSFIPLAWAEEGGASSPFGGGLGMFLPLIVIFVIFYLLIFRPQQKQQKMRKKMLADLKRGDEVITNGGIYGKIMELQEAFVMLQISSNVTVKLDRSQVNTVREPLQMQEKK